MKKIISLLALTLLLSSCQEEVKFSEPGFQAFKNTAVWRATDVSATKSIGGVVTITALGEESSVVLRTQNIGENTYYFGTNTVDNFATYNSTVNGVSSTFDTTPQIGSAGVISNLISSGSNYVASQNASTVGGTGSGLTVKTTVSNGAVTSVSILSPGNGYVSGNEITIVGGNNSAKFYVVNTENSNGEIVITDYDATQKTISGTFKFLAHNVATGTSGNETVSFQRGNFYKIPVN